MRQLLLGTFIAAAFSIACPALSERNPSAAEIDELRAQGMTERAILQTLNAQHPTPSLRFGLGDDDDDDDDVFSRAMVPTHFPGEGVDDRDSVMGAGGLLSRVWGLRRRKDADESMLDSVGRRPRWQFRWARKSE